MEDRTILGLKRFALPLALLLAQSSDKKEESAAVYGFTCALCVYILCVKMTSGQFPYVRAVRDRHMDS